MKRAEANGLSQHPNLQIGSTLNVREGSLADVRRAHTGCPLLAMTGHPTRLLPRICGENGGPRPVRGSRSECFSLNAEITEGLHFERFRLVQQRQLGHLGNADTSQRLPHFIGRIAHRLDKVPGSLSGPHSINTWTLLGLSPPRNILPPLEPWAPRSTGPLVLKKPFHSA